MIRTALFFILLFAIAVPALASEGLITVESASDVSQTADKLEAILKTKGMKIFARIDHAAGAASIGEQLRPTELLIFGNPKIGSKLMKCNQAAAIDLPIKALIYQDADGKTQLSYNDPAWLRERHSLNDCQAVLDKMSGALHNFAKAATRP